ncbi:hypothetical protein HXX76_001333 [Chlamydomonas incerta]|uniref:Uncharacterized protein n=1 Tax=Chlamydomonas incerta TaxID=51695 RepID=A0A835WBY5_CHLIN|nr:hypothetical protein HXX76_001333 [Chlamydomonas incerta]|eukprot:KAG2444588.1 hypothetical protein HXX76_001333 [Chlamydomonas incerta]
MAEAAEQLERELLELYRTLHQTERLLKEAEARATAAEARATGAPAPGVVAQAASATGATAAESHAASEAEARAAESAARAEQAEARVAALEQEAAALRAQLDGAREGRQLVQDGRERESAQPSAAAALHSHMEREMSHLGQQLQAAFALLAEQRAVVQAQTEQLQQLRAAAAGPQAAAEPGSAAAAAEARRGPVHADAPRGALPQQIRQPDQQEQQDGPSYGAPARSSAASLPPSPQRSAPSNAQPAAAAPALAVASAHPAGSRSQHAAAAGRPQPAASTVGGGGEAARAAALSTAAQAPLPHDGGPQHLTKRQRTCATASQAAPSSGVPAGALGAAGAAGRAAAQGAAGTGAAERAAGSRLCLRPQPSAGWRPVTDAMSLQPLAGAAVAAAVADGLHPQQPGATSGPAVAPTVATAAVPVPVPVAKAPVAAATDTAAVPGLPAAQAQAQAAGVSAPVQQPGFGGPPHGPASLPQSLLELQQRLIAAAAEQPSGDSLEFDFGGAELPPGPQPLPGSGALRIACCVPVAIRNVTLPACVVVEGCAPAVFRNVKFRGMPAWQEQAGGQVGGQVVVEATVTVAGAGAALALNGCCVEVAGGGGAAAALPLVPSSACVRYITGVLVKDGAAALLADCVVVGPHTRRDIQRQPPELESLGVATRGAGSSVCAGRVKVHDCNFGFAAQQKSFCVAVDCTGEACSNGFFAATGGRMWCGSQAAMEREAAAAPGTPLAVAVAALASSGGAGSHGRGHSSSGDGGGGCCATGSLVNGYAVYDSGSLLELLDGCRSERSAGPGCMAKDGGELRAVGFTSVEDDSGFLADGPWTLMELGGGCVAHASKKRGVDVQDLARIVIKSRRGAGPVAGSGLEERWDVAVESCGTEGFLANAGVLVMGVGARVVARGCGGDGFTAANGGRLHAAAAELCLAQRCSGYCFVAEDKASRVELGEEVCRAEVSNPASAKLRKFGAVVKGMLDVRTVN